MRRKFGTFLMSVGTLLLLGAVALLAYNKWDDWRAGQSVADVQDALAVLMAESSSSTTNAYVLPEIYYGVVAEDSEMATVELDGYNYIGTLSIPCLGVELPIMEEWSYAGLKISPGRFYGSVWTNNLIICGHNYERHFGKLKYLEAGDSIYFTDVNGNVFYYEVVELEILAPTQVEEMLSEDWDLTLFTCTIGGKTRVTVRCVRTTG